MKEIKKKVKGYWYFAKLLKLNGGDLEEANVTIFRTGKFSKKAAINMLAEKYPDYSAVIYDAKQRDTIYSMELNKFMEYANEVDE